MRKCGWLFSWWKGFWLEGVDVYSLNFMAHFTAHRKVFAFHSSTAVSGDFGDFDSNLTKEASSQVARGGDCFEISPVFKAGHTLRFSKPVFDPIIEPHDSFRVRPNFRFVGHSLPCSVRWGGARADYPPLERPSDGRMNF